MYLAAHLGHPSPTRMLEEMRPIDLALWRMYANLTPFGEIREDARHGIRTSVFVLANSKKGTKVDPNDFVPQFRPKARKLMTPEQQLKYVVFLNSLFGGKDERPVTEGEAA